MQLSYKFRHSISEREINMKLNIVLGIFAVMTGFAGGAGAAGPVGIGAEVSVMNRYVWRGIALNDDPVFQPSVTLGLGGFCFNVFGNMDLTDFENRSYEFTEFDYTLDYTAELPFLSVSFGAMRYNYSGMPGFEPTTEVYAGFETNVSGSPAIMIYQDVDKGEGTYIELGAAQSLPIEPFASLDISAMLGWGSAVHNRYNYEIAGMKSAFTDFSLNAGIPIGIGETVFILPSISYVSVISSDLRKNYDRNLVVFGLTASAEF